MTEEKRLRLLKDVKFLFDKNNIKFWLMYGTLLGFVRDKQFIPWDWDIDISTWYSDYDKIKNLKIEFEKLGYEVRFQEGKYSPITIYASKHDADRHGFHLDILFWIKDGNKAVELLHYNRSVFDKILDGLGRMINQDYYQGRRTFFSKKVRNKISKFLNILPKRIYNFLSESIHGIYLFTCKKTVMFNSDFNKLKTISIYNLDFKIPSNYEQFLELTYGKKWKTPNKNYSSKDWICNNKLVIKYNVKNKNIRQLWIKRWNKV